MNLTVDVLYAIDSLNKSIFKEKIQDFKTFETFIHDMVYLVADSNSRTDEFEPFRNGLYSDAIGFALFRYEKNNVIAYNQQGTRFETKEQVSTQSRIPTISSKLFPYLDAEGMSSVDDFICLTQIHYYTITNTHESDEDLARRIKSNSMFLGWGNLAQLSNDKLKNYISHAREIEKILQD